MLCNNNKGQDNLSSTVIVSNINMLCNNNKRIEYVNPFLL